MSTMRSSVVILAILGLAVLPAVAPAQAQTIVEYTLPSLNSAPVSIRTGPDGALWFTEASGNRVAQARCR